MDNARLRWIALTVAVAMFVHNLDTTLITTSLPQIAASFGLRAVDLSAAISGYVLASAALLPLSAWLSDRYGARNVFVFAVALFTLASAGCAVAQSYPQFLIARLLQGAAGALMVPVGRAVVLQRSAGRDLLGAVALITWPGLLAPVIAPLLGGVITTYSTWRWNFLLNLPLGLLAIVAALRLLPAAETHHRRTLDVPGLLYLVSGLSGLLYAMERLAGAPRIDAWTLAVLVAGIAALAWSVRHLRRASEPLLELSPLDVHTFRLSAGPNALVFTATIAATPFMLPLLLQLGYGLNALQAGPFLMAYFLGNLTMKPATNPLLRRFGFRTVMITNGVLSGLATLGCGFIDPLAGRAPALALLFVTGLCRSMQFTCLNTLAFADLAPRQRGAASTLHAIMFALATALGIAVSSILVQRLATWHGATQVGRDDFRIAFVVAGLAAVIVSLRNRSLAAGAGAQVSGHQAR